VIAHCKKAEPAQLEGPESQTRRRGTISAAVANVKSSATRFEDRNHKLEEHYKMSAAVANIKSSAMTLARRTLLTLESQ
jgi:hypothetical protein